MKKLLSFSILLMLCVSAMAQTVTLTFTGRDAASQYVQLDRVTVTDQTKGWTETLLWPDTTLTMQNGTGIADYAHNAGFALSQNNPNPFNGTTDVNLTVADAGTVTLEIVDVNGRMVVETTHALSLPTGTHQFRVSLSAAGTYMMTARQNGKTSSIKMVNNGGGKDNRIEFVGTVQSITFVLKSTTTHPFDLGDMMEYAGFATINGVEYESDRISQAQNSSQTFMLRFDVARPEVTTQNATGITATAATLNGEVTDDHNANVTERGFCYGTTPSPSLNGSYMIVGNGTGSFSSGLAELTPATNYYVRAYATNMVGTSYGQQKVFRTLDTLPVVTTAEPSGITATTFTSGGEVTVLNSASLTARGVCWNTTGTPTLADSHTTQSGDLGSFTSSVEGLACGTNYYVRAYATNNAGTAYGEEYSVTTSDTLPDVETLMAQVNATSLAIQSEVLSENCAAVTARGVCWNTAGTPTLNDNYTTDGSGMGSFTSNITELIPATDYYVRAYATNSVGTAYGQTYMYHTQDTLPVVSTTEPSGITATMFTSGGEVTALNSAVLTARGVCWNTTGTPTVADSHTTESGDLGSFTSIVEGLACGTTYYVRAYATNSAGTAYGEEYNVTTTDTLPEVEILTAQVNATSLSIQSEVLSENCAVVTARGVCWNISQLPTIIDNHTENGAGLGPFSDTILGLEPATTYYIRAYAINGDGAAYSSEVQVTTADYPTVTTASVVDITTITATCGGDVISDGGANIIARGVCWSSSPNPTVTNSHTTDSTGMGAFTSSLTGLSINTTYYVRAYATSVVGTMYGNEVSFTTRSNDDGLPCQGTPTLIDIDGNVYNTVAIGSQCWMKENLRTKKYADGTSISHGSDTSIIVAYWYYPNNNSSNFSNYGLLYNWKAVMRNSSSSNTNPSWIQGVCPTGWHVPSQAELEQLNTYVRSQSQYLCNSGSSSDIGRALASRGGWNSGTNLCSPGYMSNYNNATGFSALPAGSYGVDGYDGFRSISCFWSTTGASTVFCKELGYNTPALFNIMSYRYAGRSVRCLRDEDSSPLVTTSSVTDITSSTATSGGNVTLDGGEPVTARGVCWGTSHNPTIADNHTEDGTGTGSYISILTGLTVGVDYYLRAYATNSVGTSYGNEVSFTTKGLPCPSATTLTDRDGNTYNTVQIGSQCWMKENLRTTKYADGTSIEQGSDNYNTSLAYWYYPDNNSSNKPTYGLLYNWKAVMRNSSSSSTNPSGVQGICPTGWHVPSFAEFTQLINYVSSQSQYQCSSNSAYIAKALASTTGWEGHSQTCVVGREQSQNNATGFSALPAGYSPFSTYNHFGIGAYFWSATMDEYDNSRAYLCYLYYADKSVSFNRDEKYDAYSVRCVKD